MKSPHDDNNAYYELTKPAGESLISHLDRNPRIGRLSRHINLRQIAEDHYCLWHEAKDDEARRDAHRRFRVQVARAILSFGGFEIAIHGSVTIVTGNWVFGSLLLIIGAALYWTTTMH